MLTLLKHIRILVLEGPGHGDQAASLHLFKSIKSQGFTGLTDLIYEDSIAHKIKTIYDLPIHFNAKTIWHDSDLNVRFISLSQYRNQSWGSADFGFMATGLDRIYNTIAEFLGVKAVLHFSPHTRSHCFIKSSLEDGQFLEIHGQWLTVHGQGRFIPMPCALAQLPIRYPAPIFSEALTSLSRQYTESPNSLTRQNILHLYQAIEQQKIIPWPVYGLHEHFKLPVPAMLVKLMLAAQRLHTQQSWDKPVVLMLFNHLPPTLWEDIAQIQTQLSHAYPQLEQAPAFIQTMFAAFNRTISLSIHANQISTILSTLEPSQIAFIETGRISATAFEALFTRRSSFILPPIIEGANTKSLLEQQRLPWLSINKGGCEWSKIEFVPSPEKARDIASCAFSAKISPTDPASLSANQDIIDLLVQYIRAVNDPQSDIYQQLQPKLTESDRYTSGIDWALSQVTPAPDNASIHAALKTLLQQGQWELIKDFIDTHDITGWDNAKSRLFLWSLLYEGHTDVLLALPEWQLNHTLMHIPTAVVQRFEQKHVTSIADLVSRNELFSTNLPEDITFNLYQIVTRLKHIHQIKSTQTISKPLSESDYKLLLLLGQNATAIEIARIQNDFKDLLLACMESGLLELLNNDVLSLSQKIEILNDLSKYQYETIFRIITPALFLAWQEAYPEKAFEHVINHLPSLLINQYFREIIGTIGPIPLQKNPDFPDGLLWVVGRFSALDLIERITWMLSITASEIHEAIFGYIITDLLVFHDQDTCKALFHHFNLTSVLIKNTQKILDRSVKIENFFVTLHIIGCEPLAQHSGINHFIANSFTQGRCELIMGLSQQCPELPQIKHYASLCGSINVTSTESTELAALLPVNYTETSASWLTELDREYPGPYSFGLSFLKGLLTPALERHYSPQMSSIILSASMILLGTMFQDLTLIIHGLFSVAFALLLPHQSLAPIALVCASVLRDLFYGNMSATEILIAQGTRMIGNTSGHWTGQYLGLAVFGATRTDDHHSRQQTEPAPTTEANRITYSRM